MDRSPIYLRHLFFVEQYSKKAIARKLNLDPKTVRSALAKETFSRCHPGPRSSKLDELREKINDLLQSYPGMSAVRIYEEIRKIGYRGGISILRSYLRPLRLEKRTFLHIQTFPAEEAQVDWAYTGKIGDRISYCFLMVLSRGGTL